MFMSNEDKIISEGYSTRGSRVLHVVYDDNYSYVVLDSRHNGFLLKIDLLKRVNG